MDPLTLALLVATLVFAGIAAFLFFNRQRPKHVSKALTEALEEFKEEALEELKEQNKTARDEALKELKDQNKTERDIENTYIESAKKTFKDSIENFQTEQNKYSSKLVVNVEDLTGYTRNLSSALRSTSGSGQWGEMQLERVVELAGMVEHCDFNLQKRLLKDDGTRDIPDMIVSLPSIGKTVTGRMVVDSKAPTTNFLAANEAKDKRTREDRLKEWKNDLRGHVRTLSGKQYWDNFKESVDLVVMFLPSEAMFSSALKEDPELIHDALKKNILLASPITLISLLRMLAHGWRQVTLTEKAQQVHLSSTALFDAVKKYASHLQGIRDGLTKAVSSFDQAVGSWETRVHPRGVKLLALDIGTDSEEVLKLEKVEKDIREIDPSKT